MLPPAPVFCSIMIGWPHLACNLSAAIRASTSLMPPAGNGTMNLTGLLGNAPCACARLGSVRIVSKARESAVRRFMVQSSLGLHARILDDLKILLALGLGESSKLSG